MSARSWGHLIGKPASFDYQGTRLVGTIVATKDAGLTERGAIPDAQVTLRGESGKELTVSMVDAHLRLIEGTPE